MENLPSNFSKLRVSERDELLNKLSYFYGQDLSHLKKYYFYILKKEKVHISTIDLEKFWPSRTNVLGLYFGSYHNQDRFRLSFEGSRFITPTKNYVLLNKDCISSFVSGENLFRDEVEEISLEEDCPFLIVRYEGESLGSVSIKDKFILNYLSKGRKLDFNKLF